MPVRAPSATLLTGAAFVVVSPLLVALVLVLLVLVAVVSLLVLVDGEHCSGVALLSVVGLLALVGVDGDCSSGFVMVGVVVVVVAAAVAAVAAAVAAAAYSFDTHSSFTSISR